MTAQDAANYFRHLATELPRVAAHAIDETLLHSGVPLARSHSTGGLTPDDLRSADHPFARRHGTIQPPGREDQVNLQEGEFYKDWMTLPAVVNGDRVQGELVNAAPQADWLIFGTRKMLPRDLADALAPKLEPVLQNNFATALGRIMPP